MECSKCKKDVNKFELTTHGPNVDLLCPDCLAREASKPNTCPNCKTQAGPEDQVGMVMVPPKHTEQQKKDAPVYYAVVCPACKIIYFDDFQYNALKGAMLE